MEALFNYLVKSLFQMDEVIKILNSHLTSLQWIDSQANQLTQNVQNAKQLLIQAQHELNAQQQQQQQQNDTNNPV
jgi:hypothetical protein